ncbi:MAG: 16S rRNA (cytidine(1402)-2'-O)-methyltransferase [Candidatus Moranbacteria bacterium RIFOXYA12_FULL_44_15]|nr:MAG: 16S rRNA (cytidine(1402)-2'-O)-methyltransferase [Candidatus Moranbacteria bacterium RIFOXYA12_FULL_44_15]OGI36525.1 MAG: 16S rRNA (cytidine(1402)-2'-O)-methyltransferase [Candidatus Moranbacteria bacterium RIFOXYA2_FULL_43_15]
MATGTLYIVATPIGNLSDITFRAVEVLKQADLVVCEDTRVSRRLLNHYEINTSLASFYKSGHGGSVKPVPKVDYIVEELKSGKNIAFITDAGTPGISDPGNLLVEAAVREGICVIPIPGASALTALASVSGIDLAQFVFLGFPPHKKGRETFFKKLIAHDMPVIYYESPHRLIKNLELLKTLAPKKNIILGRELTKMFEEIVRGTVGEVLEYFNSNPGKIKGEIAIIVY